MRHPAFLLTKNSTQTPEPKPLMFILTAPYTTTPALKESPESIQRLRSNFLHSFILLFALTPSSCPGGSQSLGPQAQGACCPPRSPPVRVAAPASVRRGAGRGPHGLACSAGTPVDADVRVRTRGGPGRLPGSAAPPHPPAQLMLPGRSDPTPKLGTKKE